MKKCCKCKKIKSLTEFHLDRKNRHSKCKECRNTYEKERRKVIKKKFNNLYGTWHVMKSRCKNPTDKSYKYYGGRGIKICEEWNNDFLSFYKWAIENGHKKGLQIDRRNNDGNYEPNNCRFVTLLENVRNRSNILPIEKVYEIRRLLENSNFSQKKIGNIVNVSQNTVSVVYTGRRWSHIAIRDL